MLRDRSLRVGDKAELHARATHSHPRILALRVLISEFSIRLNSRPSPQNTSVTRRLFQYMSVMSQAAVTAGALSLYKSRFHSGTILAPTLGPFGSVHQGAAKHNLVAMSCHHLLLSIICFWKTVTPYYDFVTPYCHDCSWLLSWSPSTEVVVTNQTTHAV